jgi:hypothetical protein
MVGPLRHVLDVGPAGGTTASCRHLRLNYHVLSLQIKKYAYLFHKRASAPVVTHLFIKRQVTGLNLTD